jgi:hypothetical protein
MARDFTKARKKATDAADAAVGDRLDKIDQQASELAGIFDDLKLTDQATYDALVAIVEDATEKNLSIASVIDNVKALGAAGTKLAGKLGDLSSGGAMQLVANAIKLSKGSS